MDINNREDHIEDILSSLHSGQWFGWSDSKNKVYANLILTEKMGVGGELTDNPHTLPTEKFLTDALVQAQSDFDAQEYARNRKLDYPDIGDQLDALYHAGVFPANMAAKIKETKDKYPKG